MLFEEIRRSTEDILNRGATLRCAIHVARKESERGGRERVVWNGAVNSQRYIA